MPFKKVLHEGKFKLKIVKFLNKEQSEASATLVPSPLKLGAKGSYKNKMEDAKKAAAVRKVSFQAGRKDPLALL